MAAAPIYGKNPSKIFSRTSGRFPGNFVCKIGDSGPIIVCSSDDPTCRLTFYGKVKFRNLGFSLKVKTVDLSIIIAACDLKIDRCKQLMSAIY